MADEIIPAENANSSGDLERRSRLVEVTLKWKTDPEAKPLRPKVTFKELDRFIALMLNELCTVSKNYGNQQRRELADGLIEYTLFHAGKAYFQMIISDSTNGPEIVPGFASIDRPDQPPEVERLVNVRKWITGRVRKFMYGQDNCEVPMIARDKPDLEFLVYPPPPEPSAEQPNTATAILPAQLPKPMATPPELGAARELQPAAKTAPEKETPSADNVFHKAGAVWRVVYNGGQEFMLKDTFGAAYLAHLLQTPNTPCSVLDLENITAKAPPTKATLDHEDDSMGEEDSDEIADNKELKEVRRKLEEIAEERETAMSLGNNDRCADLDEEVEILKQQLRKATGLGGRSRKFKNPADSSRVRVKQCIDAAIENIRPDNRDLHDHLFATIMTGYKCVYKPAAPISWNVKV